MALYKGTQKICPVITKGITPTGTINITQNGTVDVTNYASANVNVSGGGGSIFTEEPKTVGTITCCGWLFGQYNSLTQTLENGSAGPGNYSKILTDLSSVRNATVLKANGTIIYVVLHCSDGTNAYCVHDGVSDGSAYFIWLNELYTTSSPCTYLSTYYKVTLFDTV